MIRGNVSGLSFGNISFEFGGGWLRVNEYGLPQYQAGYGPIPEPFPPHLGNGFAFPGSCVMWGKHHRVQAPLLTVPLPYTERVLQHTGESGNCWSNLQALPAAIHFVTSARISFRCVRPACQTRRDVSLWPALLTPVRAAVLQVLCVPAHGHGCAVVRRRQLELLRVGLGVR